MKFLTKGGAVAAAILGSVIFAFGGIPWAIPLLFFFVLSSVLSILARHFQPELSASFAKDERRDAMQVIANGGLGGILAIVSVVADSHIVGMMYAGSLAAVTADTWGTEIGVLLRGTPIDICTFRRVAPGSSGGISLPGTVGSAAGALCIVLAAGPLLMAPTTQSQFIVLAGGMTGSLVDSVLGSRWQLQYRCKLCGRLTELTRHCATATEYYHGYRWMTNDAVNLICSATGMAISALFVHL